MIKKGQETLITNGHHIYNDGKDVHVTFFDNADGKRLKRMWDILHQEPKKGLFPFLHKSN